ncbi:hypothetical protein [Streptomyces sp. MS1.AVA.4]|uniref:Uncharacterized protein n=1 Tax=Streptomyces pratisoli TaxID=3139917 RepID=A0ACC6QH57_9ACTN
MFVDESGRRSKKFRRVGWVLALICAGYAVTLVVALIGGNSDAPSLLIPGVADDKDDSAGVTPGPTDAPSDPAAPADAVGGPSPSDTPAALPQQPSGAAGDPAGGGLQPSPSADPGTSAQVSTGGAGGPVGTSPDPKPSPSLPAGGSGSGGSGGEEPTPDDPDPSPSTSASTEPSGQPVGQAMEQGSRQLAAEGAL